MKRLLTVFGVLGLMLATLTACYPTMVSMWNVAPTTWDRSQGRFITFNYTKDGLVSDCNFEFILPGTQVAIYSTHIDLDSGTGEKDGVYVTPTDMLPAGTYQVLLVCSGAQSDTTTVVLTEGPPPTPTPTTSPSPTDSPTVTPTWAVTVAFTGTPGNVTLTPTGGTVVNCTAQASCTGNVARGSVMGITINNPTAGTMNLTCPSGEVRAIPPGHTDPVCSGFIPTADTTITVTP